MKTVQYILFFLMLTSLFAGAGEIQWRAEPESASESQPSLLYFFSTAASDWQKDQHILQNPLVQKMARSYHCFKMDIEQSPYHPVLKKYNIFKSPTIILLKSEGAEKARFEGSFTTEQLLTEMGQLAGPSLAAPQLPDHAPDHAPDAEAAAPWALLCTDEQDVEGGQRDLLKAEYRIDGGNLHLRVAFQGAADINGFHFCLNADKDPETGFISQNIAGYELMIEGGALYAFGGKQPTEWVWNSLTTVNYTLEGSLLKLELPLAQANLKPDSSYPCGFNTSNDEWITVDYMPDNQPADLKIELEMD